MISLKLENFGKHLKEKGIAFDTQAESNQLLIINKIEHVEFPLFVRIMEESDLIQLLLFFPTKIKKETLSDLARALHLLNKELDIPGFGMDEKSDFVYFRALIPCNNNKCDPAIFDKYLNAVQMIGKSFLPLVAATSQGLINFEEVQKRLNDMTKK